MNQPRSVDSLLARLLALPPAERAEQLLRACAEDPGLRTHLAQIRIVLHDMGEAPLPQPGPISLGAAMHVLEAALDTPATETSGTTIGPYKLLQQLGEGGFGVVWMAEQFEPIRRRVALKIIKTGMDTEEVIARFEAERQALALMEHPNIARVFDAGATSAGRPYFVMELVRGVPITRYCDENRVPTEARLRLFATVCHAVQHAHQKGIIHRDLKPSNLLVTLHDGVPVPKIIDFGIAKATDKQLTEKTLFTQFHAFLGTPAYTSPEQMEMSGLDVDTRSDIYSLGVLLYELLTGRPPFDPETLARSGLDAMRRTIREIEPPRPSTRLGTLSDADRSSVAHQRSTDPARLSLLLRGDLDWVVMRCLEKDRTRRYEAASALARDVERHLSSEPVTARPPSRLYRMRKFVRRHRVGVAAGAAVAVSIVGGLIASSALFVSERAAHGRATAAEKQQSDLRREAELARAAEVKRVARTALDLANRHLADGRVAEGLAWLVYAARKDPANRALGPRLASVITSHNFALPRAAPIACGSRVLALRFARDGRTFFAGTEDGTFRVFDSESGALLRQFRLGPQVVPAGWEFPARNDTVVGARSPDNTFAVHDVVTGTARFPPLQLDPGVGNPDSPRVAGLSPDGRWIYANGRNRFWLWNAETGALLFDPTFKDVVGGCDFSPAGDVLALPVGDFVKRWSLPTGQPVGPDLRFRQAAAPPLRFNYEVRFSPDGRRLAVVEQNRAQIFDAASGNLLRQLPPLEPALNPSFTAFATNDRLLGRSMTQTGWWDLTSGQFNPLPVPNVSEVSLDAAGRRGAAFSRDGWLRIFDFDGSVVEPTWRQDAAYSTAISPDGSQVLMGTADGMLHRFRFSRGPGRSLTLRPPLLVAHFLPEPPSRLLVLTKDNARVIHVATGREGAGGFSFPESVQALKPGQPGLKLMVVRTAKGGWQSWALDPGGVRKVVTLEDSASLTRPRLVVISPRGDRVVIGSPSPLQVWDLQTGARIGPPIQHSGQIQENSPSFSPDGGRLAVSTRDGAALVFDIATGQPLLRLATQRQVVTFSAFFSPDGSRLLTTNFDGAFRLWHSDTGEPIGPGGRMTASVAHPAYSPNSRWAVIRNTTAATLLDVQTGSAVGQTIPIGSAHARFSPDSHRLATVGHVPQARVWDAPSGEPVTEPLSHPAEGIMPEISPDGRFLKTESPDRLHLSAVPPALPEGMPPPDWLLELATLCASQVVNEAGQLVPALEAAARVEHLRQRIAMLPADAPLAEWGRWLLDERPERPIAPGFTVTPAEAEDLASAAATNR